MKWTMESVRLVDGVIMRLFPELALYIYTCVQLVSIFPAICYVVQFVAKQTTLSCNTAAAFQLCISVAIALICTCCLQSQNADGGSIMMTVDTTPTEVLVYYATTLQNKRCERVRE